MVHGRPNRTPYFYQKDTAGSSCQKYLAHLEVKDSADGRWSANTSHIEGVSFVAYFHAESCRLKSDQKYQVRSEDLQSFTSEKSWVPSEEGR